VTPDDRSRLRALLEETRRAVVGEGTSAVGAAGTGPVASDADEDQAPHDEMDRAISSSRNRLRADRIRRIDAALARLAADPERFGECERCGEDIPLRRLEAVPDARLCVECQAGEDPARGGSRRRVTDYRD